MTAPESPPEPAPSRPLSVALRPRVARELDDLRAATGQTRGELVNHAVSLLAFVTDAGTNADLVLRNRETGELTLVRLL